MEEIGLINITRGEEKGNHGDNHEEDLADDRRKFCCHLDSGTVGDLEMASNGLGGLVLYVENV